MFHAPMARFQLQLIYFYYLFLPSTFHLIVFLSCRPFVINATFSTGFVECRNFFKTQKGLQERKTTIEWDNDGKIGNKNVFVLSTFVAIFFFIRLQEGSLFKYDGNHFLDKKEV